MTFYTSEQYDNGVKRILDLQNPKRYPLSIEHQWELNDLMTAACKYEDDREREAWEQQHTHQGWPGDGTGEDDFADYNQNEGNDW